MAIIKILKDMCKTPNIRENINIEHETPPKYEDIEIDIDIPPNYE